MLPKRRTSGACLEVDCGLLCQRLFGSQHRTRLDMNSHHYSGLQERHEVN